MAGVAQAARATHHRAESTEGGATGGRRRGAGKGRGQVGGRGQDRAAGERGKTRRSADA